MVENLSILEVCARARKARLRATSERAVRDAVKAKELDRNEDGTFDAVKVQAWIERKLSQVSPREEREESASTVREVMALARETIAEARTLTSVLVRHLENILSQFQNTTGAALTAIVNTNTTLSAQLQESQDNLIEMQCAFGELNLKKAEIKAQEDLSKAKMEKLTAGFMAFTNMLPSIMTQAAGQRDLKAMFSGMTPEMRELFIALGNELPTDEQRVTYRKNLEKLGVKPVTPVGAGAGVTQ